MSDGRRPHRFPEGAAGEEIISWACQECGEWVNEYKGEENDGCPVDWYPKKADPVSHPPHYTRYSVEVIELTEDMNFCRGNAVKYLARAGFKGGADQELEDLRKAAWYVQREIERLQREIARREGKPK